jgi:hypothetical protein
MKTSIISVVVGALAICGLIVVEAEGDKAIRGALLSDEDFGAAAEGEHDTQRTLYYSSKGAKYSSKGKGGSKGSKGDDDDDDATEEPTVAPTKKPRRARFG